MEIIIDNAVCSNGGDMAIAMSIKKVLSLTYGNHINVSIYDSNHEACKALYPEETFYPLLSELLFEYQRDWGRRRKLSYLAKWLYTWFGLYCIKYRIFFGKFVFPQKIYNSIKKYRDADLILSTGGTYLVEHYDLRHRFIEFDICRFFDKHLCLYTQSMGPFSSPYNKQEMKKNLDYAFLVLLRDRKSLKHIEDLIEDKKKCHVVADSVFALFDPQHIKKHQSFEKAGKFTNVAISVREWSHFQKCANDFGMSNYKSSIKQLVEWLIKEHNVQVTFISTCQGLPSYRYDDSLVAQEIYDSLPEEIRKSVNVDKKFHTTQELIDFCQNVDLVFATRMHMMILSLCGGTPVIPIAYEFKQIELSKRLDIEELCLDIEDITFEKAKQVTDRYLLNSLQINKCIFDYVQKEYQSTISVSNLLEL